MATDSLSRFQKRRKMKNSITVYEDGDEQLVSELLNSEVNQAKVDDIYNSLEEHYDMSVSEEDAQAFLVKFKKDFNDERFNKLIHDCKKDVINSIVTPFGIGHIVAAYDKTGGNVDTIHNVRNKEKTGIGMSADETKKQDGLGVYATEEAKNTYTQREEYSNNKTLKKNYHSGNKNYAEKQDTYKKLQDNGDLTDAYNGKSFSKNDKVQVEHVISTEEIHNDAGRILSEQDGSDLANTDSNLKPVIQSVNGSKQNDSATQFIKRVKENKEKIKVLEAKSELTPEEKKGLERLKRVTDVDEEKIKQLDKQARQAYDKKLNEYYKSEKFIKNTAITSANEGAKMGMQQALGMIITEFFTAVFDEIADIYKNGFSNGFDNDKFFSVLKERLKRIAVRIKDKWKDAAIAFKDGFISGFLSNLVTTAINAFVTTGKRVVRIIREGLFSLYRAVKILLFPPENLTFEEAMHEAKKLIATGIIVSLGVIVEEWIDKLIKGTAILEPFSDMMTTIFIGALTGLTITMVVYYIDKKKNDKELFNNLVCDTNDKFDKLNDLLASFNPNRPIAKAISTTK